MFNDASMTYEEVSWVLSSANLCSDTSSSSVPNIPHQRLISAGSCVLVLLCHVAHPTYRHCHVVQVESSANALATQLLDSGIQPGARVGVLLSRGLHMPIAMLAVLKAGGTYVPLDPYYPQVGCEHCYSLHSNLMGAQLTSAVVR